MKWAFGCGISDRMQYPASLTFYGDAPLIMRGCALKTDDPFAIDWVGTVHITDSRLVTPSGGAEFNHSVEP